MSLLAKDATGANQNLPLYDPAYSYVCIITAAQSATPTNLFQLAGAAGVVARVKFIQVAIRSGSAASSAATSLTINRYSTAATGGTPVNNAVGKHDTNNAAASCVPTHFTANPTAGTKVAVLRRFTATLAGTATDNTNQVFTYQCTDKGDQPFVVRGASDFLTIDLAVAFSTAQTAEIMVQWEEGTA